MEKKFYVVTFVHRNLELWHKHLQGHQAYLESAVKSGVLRASGRVRGLDPVFRHGMLIFHCVDREELIQSLTDDPFHRHGVIDELRIVEWDPVYGAFASQSTGSV